MEQIFELKDKDKITGEIYLITNITENKLYVGQTRSHRMNKGKYRPFGSKCRFKDHISEAINNTKKNQCVYLNNAIRKYGSDNFKTELIEKCEVIDLNKREQYYILKYNSLFPNGYNLTTGGQVLPCDNNIVNNAQKNNPKKRGREFGFKHTQETINKMKERLTDNDLLLAKKNTMTSVMTSYYDNKKVDILSQYILDDDITKYIKPVCKKNSNEVYNYIIRIEGRKLTLAKEDDSLEQKYKRLLDILTTVKIKQNGMKCNEVKRKIIKKKIIKIIK
jgi:group I intron endonuclease